jgi:predicted nucleic acid-binding protein
VSKDEYKSHISNALMLLNGHTKDKEFVALSLLLNCKVWSYEERLFKIGVAISTKELADMLRVSGWEL